MLRLGVSPRRVMGALGLAVLVSHPHHISAQIQPGRAFDIQGCTYSSWNAGAWADPENATQLRFIAGLGVNIVSVQYSEFVDRSTGQFYSDPIWDDFAGLPDVLRRARALGLHTAVRVNLYTETHTSLLDPFPIANPAQFFNDFKNLVLRHARVAQDAGADLLILGSEMNAMTGAAYRSYWLDIIASTRRVFSGQITYGYFPNLSFPPLTQQALNQELSFWDQLDYVGLSIYHPLSFSTSATIDSLTAAWYRNPIYPAANRPSLIENIRLFNRLTGKRLLFTEIGYRSIDGAATNPGSSALEGAVDFQEQADLYTTMLSVMTREGDPSWLAGMLLFDCAIAPRPRSNFYTNPVWGWSKNFSLDDKPAADIVRRFFTGAGGAVSAPTLESPTVNGATVSLRWTPPSAGQVLGYVLEAGSTPGATDLATASVGGSLSITATVPAGTYSVRVRAQGLGGLGPASNEVTFSVSAGGGMCAAAPAPPLGLGGAVLNGVATVHWNAVPSAVSYVLQAGPTPGTSSFFDGTVGGTVSVSSPVGPNFRAYVRVYAINACGRSGPSPEMVLQ